VVARAQVKITAAKGRPMLTWVGKRPLSHLPAFPSQLVERFEAATAPDPAAWKDWPAKYPKGGLLFHGDNKEVLAHLLANGFRGKVQLIYIDPPFDSGADYVRRVGLRGPTGSTKIAGESYTLGEQIQYTDIWANDSYLQFMYERLLLLNELLSSEGTLYLHCDVHRSHFLRCLLEEVFGASALTNEIVWKRTSARSDSRTFNHIHDSIFLVTKTERFTFNNIRVPYSQDYVDRYFTMVDPATGRKFQGTDLTARGLRNGETGKIWRGFDPGQKGNHWLKSPVLLDDLDRQGRIYWPVDGGWPRLKYFIDEAAGLALQSVWTDIAPVNSQAADRSDYPTEKPEDLLERIIEVSSKHGDTVLDCFIGSGTTAAVAQKLGRRWIGCDINKGAIQTTAKRLQKVIEEQAAAAQAPAAKQGSLIDQDESNAEAPGPAQLGFTTWRVNDYDLQIQHDEAVNLACEHLGVQRTRGDRYFDGTLGRSLVKIVSFDHPLSPVDIEDLKRELDSRKDEDRDVTFVCLGIELAAQASVDDWNRLRKGQHAPNRLHVIELRRDAKHGGWLNHMPADADVSITRKGGSIVVAIKDFISPSIVERLTQQAGVLEPKIDDCRAMVDSVAIDTAYNGAVLNVTMVDVPERKADFVEGRYELPAPRGTTTVAVRITDMLGEEVLVTKLV
jgi:adenine-specific DNA-methyltransferase